MGAAGNLTYYITSLKNILPCDSESLLSLSLNITDERKPQEHLDPHQKQCSKLAMHLYYIHMKFIISLQAVLAGKLS